VQIRLQVGWNLPFAASDAEAPIGGARDSGVPRYLAAGGTGSLEVQVNLMLSGFGELDLDAQLDLGKHGIQTRIA
jgi:putative NADH-flavin reductase